MSIPSPSEILSSRLNRLNRQLLLVSSTLTEEEVSTWPTKTAPSCKWHIWHMARWADYVQSLLSPIVDEQTPELWEADGIEDEWGFDDIDLGMWNVGSGLGNENGQTLPLPSAVKVTSYAKKAFALLEGRVAELDNVQFDSPFTDWHDVDTSIGDAMIGYLAHANRHLGMLEAISGVLGKDGTATV